MLKSNNKTKKHFQKIMKNKRLSFQYAIIFLLNLKKIIMN